MAELQKYRDQIIAMFLGLTKKQKIIFFSVAVLAIAGVVIFINWITKTEYKVLFSELNAEDANAIIQKLKDSKITYQIADGGSTILIPAESLYEQRLSLAGQGLPKKGKIGFEIFDKTNLVGTEFEKEMNYQRALQGELSQTINQLEGVSDSRIHITIPKTRLLTDMEKAPTASIVLYLKPQATINSEQVQGIVHLICSSVEGLKPDNVSVLDNYGNLISDNLQKKDEDIPDPDDVLAKYYKLKKNIETDLQNKVETLMDSLVGAKKAVVQISVEINMDKREIDKETYIPVKGTSGVLRSEQVLDETYEGGGSPPGGGAKTDQKIPSYPAAQGGNNKNNYKRGETISNYEISTEKMKHINMPGEIKYISVGVGIDKNLALTAEDLTSIKDLVASSIGLNSQRDQIKVASIAFNGIAQQLPAPGAGEKIAGMIPFKYLYIMVALIVFLLAITILLSRRKVFIRVEEKEEKPAAITAEEMPLALEDRLKPGEIDLGLTEPVLSLEDKRKKAQVDNLIERIQGVAQESPENIAVLFRVWLGEDE